MKKLLGLLGAVGLVATTSATVVSCGKKDTNDKLDDVVIKGGTTRVVEFKVPSTGNTPVKVENFFEVENHSKFDDVKISYKSGGTVDNKKNAITCEYDKSSHKITFICPADYRPASKETLKYNLKGFKGSKSSKEIEITITVEKAAADNVDVADVIIKGNLNSLEFKVPGTGNTPVELKEHWEVQNHSEFTDVKIEYKSGGTVEGKKNKITCTYNSTSHKLTFTCPADYRPASKETLKYTLKGFKGTKSSNGIEITITVEKAAQ